MHSGFLPDGVHPGFLAGGALQGAGVQSDLASQNHISHSGGGSFVQANPQLPLSQAQCEQFLNFLKCHMATGSSNDGQTGHQAAAVMTSYPSIPHFLPSTSSSPSTSSNFSSNSLWIPPNLSHSIFAAQVVCRQAYKSNTWIIDTRGNRPHGSFCCSIDFHYLHSSYLCLFAKWGTGLSHTHRHSAYFFYFDFN